MGQAIAVEFVEQDAGETMTENLPSQLAVVGLGYVGLPLATAFSQVLPTIGFDINQERITELKKGLDRNGEMTEADLTAAPLEMTADPAQLQARRTDHRRGADAGRQGEAAGSQRRWSRPAA